MLNKNNLFIWVFVCQMAQYFYGLLVSLIMLITVTDNLT